MMVEMYLKAMKHRDEPAMTEVFDAYTALHPYINNWDLVDLSVIKIVGNHEVLHPHIDLMDKWIEPAGHSMWQQRIAMVSTWIAIRHGYPDVCFRRAEVLLTSPHDLLHKAAGWMLREAWKKGYRDELRTFLHNHILQIPSVMLSYATEQMSPHERLALRQARRPGPV